MIHKRRGVSKRARQAERTADRARYATQGIGNMNAALRARSKRGALDRFVKDDLGALYQQDSIVNFATGAGTSIDPSVQGIVALSDHTYRLSPPEIDWLYTHSDLIRRICDTVVTDAWQSGYQAVDSETGEAVADPHGFDSAYKKACMYARRTGVGAVFLWTDTDPKTWIDPLDPSEEFVRFLPLEREEIPTVGDIQNGWDDQEYFGQPEHYGITPIIKDQTLDEVLVHPSRLFFARGEEVPKALASLNDGWDDSIIQQVYGAVSRFLQTEMGITNIVVRFEIATMAIAGLEEVLSTVDGPLLLRERMELNQRTAGMYNAVIVDAEAGEEYTRKFASLQGLDTAWDRMAHSVAKAARMSMTRLFGMAPSGLATDDQSGRANWRIEIQSYRSDKVEGGLLAYYRRYLGRTVDIVWSKIEELTEADEAKLEKERAASWDLLARTGAITPEVLLRILVERGVVPQWALEEQGAADLNTLLNDPDVQSAARAVLGGGDPASVGAEGGSVDLAAPDVQGAAAAISGSSNPSAPAGE